MPDIYKQTLLRTAISFLGLLCVCCHSNAQMRTADNPILPLRADWIGCPGADVKGYAVFHFRKSFELNALPQSFVVCVSADQRYRLFVNGKPVVFGPARGDLLHWNYETIDIAPFLRTGKNILAAAVWNMGSGAPAAQLTAQTAFLLQGRGEAEKIVNTDSSWCVIRNEGYYPEPFPASRLASYIVGSCDSVRFEKYPFGWEQLSYDDRHWLKPETEPKARYYTDKRMLQARALPMMEETPEPIGQIVRVQGIDSAALIKTFKEKGVLSVPALTTVSVLIDRKVLTTGYPEIRFSGGHNGSVKITYAESLFDAHRRKGNRNEIAGKQILGYYDVFLPDGGSAHLFRPLWMRTYRYLQLDITTAADPLLLDSLQSVFTAYPFTQNAVFTTSDKTLEEIWSAGWRTARLCANETYMDCPYYEQLQYVGDTRIQALISLYVSGDDRLMRNAIEQFHQSQIPDGLTMDAYPARSGKFIPPFSLFWISLLHDYARYRNDPAFVKKYLVPMEAVLQWFASRVDTNSGMLGRLGFWNFVDWSFPFKGIPPGGMDGNSAILSLQFVYTLDQAADLFRQSGEPEKAARYKRLGDSMRKAVYRHCYDPKWSLIADSPERSSFSQHANIWAILTDCVPSAKQKELMKQVLYNDSLVQASLYYRFYLTRALKKAGLADLYLGTLKPWKDMLALGLSTFPETTSPATRSDCHAWSASPCYDFLCTVCGIDAGEPGFGTVKIEPHLGGLRNTSCRMPHPKGMIQVEYHYRDKQRMEAVITLPAGLTGRFVAGANARPLHSGRQVLYYVLPEKY
ncbi:MAG: alpha-L-rhamnosidase [Bacteroidetes bacterium]|nr:alpha-L-rhamnosidase [Bacteroidota bacterium]